jgi:hypothetical protein
MRVVILVLAVTLCPVRAALAWGDTGHLIICEIAFQELTDTARQRVDSSRRRPKLGPTVSRIPTWWLFRTPWSCLSIAGPPPAVDRQYHFDSLTHIRTQRKLLDDSIPVR